MAEPAPEPRVLSLLSASTEIVHRLGCSHLLVGRSHGCDDPPMATVLPVATAPKVDPNAPSAAIDSAVRAQAEAGGPIYLIHDVTVRELQPNVIITQEQCRICAVTPDDVAAACKGMPAAKMVVIKPVTLDDVYGDVMTIATALGKADRGVRLVGFMKQRVGIVAQQCSAVAAAAGAGAPAVAHVEWLAPLMGSGYWITECVNAAGCEMVHGVVGGHSPTLPNLASLAGAAMLVVAPCGFSIERTHAELEMLKLRTNPEWLRLPAVRTGRVYVADGNKYFNRSSCGVVDTAEIVAEMAWPSLVGLWGHHGKNWVRLSELDAFCDRVGAPPPTKHVAVAATPPSGQTDLKQGGDGGGSDGGGSGGGGDPTAVQSHVEKQIAFLRTGEFLRAFELNSTANRARLGNAATFEKVVKSNSSFAALADPNNPYACAFNPTGNKEGMLLVEATVQASHAGEAITFGFDVCESNGKHATEGVRIMC